MAAGENPGVNGEKRLRLGIQGAVQGVGFRPFVFRLAEELELRGRVVNDSRGVHIEVEGPGPEVERFLERLPRETPPHAIVHAIEPTWHEPRAYPDFRIEASEQGGAKIAFVLPDIATCDQCLAEVLDPANRRHHYPFTNCTHCGPRYTILQALPYDRPSTTMERFVMCSACRREYEDPRDRRFHAQPNACPRCGPRLELWDGALLASEHSALQQATAGLLEGRILALKGLGGFHLMVDARNDAAVTRLRQRKQRYQKPFALMVPDLATARALCRLPADAEDLLAAPQAPIVLLERRPGAKVAAAVAPGHRDLGLMLPYTPLHHILLREISIPVVATSGNLSDQPIVVTNQEAREQLGEIADLFLVHDRPIARRVDDSVVRGFDGAPQILRRARGYAPLPIALAGRMPTVLAVGAQLKNTVALAVDGQVFVSQHLGDMETLGTRATFVRTIRDFLDLYQAVPETIVHDLHPDYSSTRWAQAVAEGKDGEEWTQALHGVPLVAVQHHHAHLASCLAENEAHGPALGVTWDGTGYGTDGLIWGGEFLHGDAKGFERVACLRPFGLPGGEAAVREPRRAALSLLWELMGESALERFELAPAASLTAVERRILKRMLADGFQTPVTTSAGRLFDAVAALLDLHQQTSYEGQAAMALEGIAEATVDDAYPLPLVGGSLAPLELDWRPLIAAILEEQQRGVAPGIIARRFHNALAEGIVAVARETGESSVALTGGCFHSRLLSEHTVRLLRQAGFEVLLHRRVPPGDGGLCLGQVAVAAARSRNRPPLTDSPLPNGGS